MRPKNKSVPMIDIKTRNKILCDSRAEALVGYEIQIAGYKYKHDQEYPYEQNKTGKRYDFLLLTTTGKEYKTKFFIEVKGDNEEHWENDLKEKQRMVDKNGDYLIDIYEKDIGSVSEKIKETLDLMQKEKSESKPKKYLPHFYNKSSLKEKNKA